MRDVPWRRSQFNVSFSLVCDCACVCVFMFQIGCFDLIFLLLRPSALCSHLFRFSVNKHDDDDWLNTALRRSHQFHGSAIGGEMSKCQGVLFDWLRFSSKREGEL